MLEPSKISKQELFFTTRTSFNTNDYMGDIIKRSRSTKGIDFSILPPIIVGIAVSSITIPLLPLSVSEKNVLGLLCLSLPFVILSLLILLPNLQTKVLGYISNKTTTNQAERIVYHEAGHFLAGYLCGLPIIGYDTSGEKDAGTTIDFSVLNPSVLSPISSQSISPLMGGRCGHLLVVAMAGVVAETLRFGDSYGGVEDFPVALEGLRLSGVPLRDRDDVLRWGILKALNLLRIYRDELDAVAEAMSRGKSVVECIDCIERVHVHNDSP